MPKRVYCVPLGVPEAPELPLVPLDVLGVDDPVVEPLLPVPGEPEGVELLVVPLLLLVRLPELAPGAPIGRLLFVLMVELPLEYVELSRLDP